MTQPAQPDDLQRVVDTQAVVDIAVGYTWALDARDWPALEAVFTADATADLGGTRCEGRDAIVAKCVSALSPLDGSHHLVGNHQVDIDGDRATHRCYVHAQHMRNDVDGSGLFVIAGRYEDRLVRTADGWRISHRDLVVTWNEGNPAVLGRALRSE